MSSELDPIRLEVFKHLFSAIAEEMGTILRRASYSPNIKERRDFSCGVFDHNSRMIAQAAHIPVHLGSMPLSVSYAVNTFSKPSSISLNPVLESFSNPESDVCPGDMILLNDPFSGGTHLPDITLITPVFMYTKTAHELIGYVASRAHHADVGGITPGSMPVARDIYQEGLIIPPIKLMQGGKLNQAALDIILANVRTREERLGDLWAQIAANQRGVIRFLEIVNRYGLPEIRIAMRSLLAYTEKMTRYLLSQIPDGAYQFTDYLDDNGLDDKPVPIHVKITIRGDQAIVDFTGSGEQQSSSVNAVYAITISAIFYVFLCLLGLDVPNNDGCLAPIEVIAPSGTVINAMHPAPVAGGNVETSQRIVDVLLGALAQACPEKIPAASQGTMNNITIGGWDECRVQSFAYYETIGGGMGASKNSPGLSAIHSHMTNTRNTPIEAIEYNYPLRVLRYAIRRGSGGVGAMSGGNGIQRDIQLLSNAQITLLSERRRLAPYGMRGGNPGLPGENLLIRGENTIVLPGKITIEVEKGDIISINTPGGGGYGSP
jgi:N-methylhydantoinase B